MRLLIFSHLPRQSGATAAAQTRKSHQVARLCALWLMSYEKRVSEDRWGRMQTWMQSHCQNESFTGE
jgi:hypothetical protein